MKAHVDGFKLNVAKEFSERQIFIFNLVHNNPSITIFETSHRLELPHEPSN